MKKKYWALGAGIVLSLVLCTGCGEQAVLDKMYDTSFDSASVNVAFDSDIAITAKNPDESTNITSSVEIKGAVSGISENTFVSKLEGSISYNYADADADWSEVNVYYENESAENSVIPVEPGNTTEGVNVFSAPYPEDAEDPVETEDESDDSTFSAGTTQSTIDISGNEISESANNVIGSYPQIGNSILYLCDDAESEDWYYESKFDEDIEYQVTLEGVDKFKNAIKDVVYKTKKKGSKKVGNEDCYILQKKLTSEDVNVLMQAAVDSFMCDYDLETFQMDLEDLLLCSVEDFVNVSKPVLNIYVSKTNGYFMGGSLDLSKIDVKKYLKTIEWEMQDLADDVAVEAIRSVKVKSALLSLELSDVNNAVVTIPSDVRAVYEEDWLNLDDWDDWDFEDFDDEDWEDEEDDEDWEDEEDDEDWEDEDWDTEDDEDDEDDEDWEDEEEDEEDEDEDASDATTVSLYDESGNFLCDLNVPSSVHYYPDYSEDSCVDFMNGDWTIDCMVSSTIDQGYASFELEEFLFADDYRDEDDDEEFEPSVNYSKESFTIKVMGGTAYYMTGAGEEGQEYYIVVPYTNAEGETDYITVSFEDNHVEGWERQNYIDFANQMFN